MRVLSLVKKHVVPLFNNYDYKLTFSEHGVFIFSNHDDSVQITLIQHKSRHCPPELFIKFAKNLKDAPSLPPPSLSIQFSVRADLVAHSFIPKDFQLEKPFAAPDFYYDETSFISLAQSLSQDALDYVRPILEGIAPRAIFLRDAPYTLLAQNPQEQARQFASKHGLSLQIDTPCNVEKIFNSLLPADHTRRKIAFHEHTVDIAGFAAYCGELILKHRSGSWSELKPLNDLSGHLYRFGVKFANVEKEIDLLWYIVTSWNFSPQIKNVGLFSPEFINRFKT